MCVNDDGGYSCIEFPSAAPSLPPSIAPSASPTVKSRSAWVRLGQILQGAVYGDDPTIMGDEDIDFGRDISINGAGNMIAVGVKDAFDDNCGVEHGAVYVFALDRGNWKQVGSPIYSPDCDVDLEFGYHVELSSDGQSLAISSQAGVNDFFVVAIYEYVGSDWIAKGSPIFPDDGYSYCSPDDVDDMAFSGDGNTVAVVYFSNSSYPFTEVYRYDGDWVRYFFDEACDDCIVGNSVSLSYDGNRLAVGDSAYSAVYVVEFQAIDDWLLVLNYTDSSCDAYSLGTAVSLSSDGTVLAVSDSEYGYFHGAAYVLQDNGGSFNNWSQVGQTLTGGNMMEFFGKDVALDADGNTLAVGSLSACAGTAGYVNVYVLANDVWVKLGREFGDESNAGYDYARSVELSDDGRTLATGANDAPTSNGYTDGIAEVYRYVQISG